MKLTLAASYALRAVAYMAHLQQSRARKKDERLIIASHAIQEELKIPERFLLKVLKPLVGAQVLNSIKGPNGGYSLAKPPSEITVLEIIEAVYGHPIRGAAPVGKAKPEPSFYKRLEHICCHIAEQTRKHLGKIKLTELM